MSTVMLSSLVCVMGLQCTYSNMVPHKDGQICSDRGEMDYNPLQGGNVYASLGLSVCQKDYGKNTASIFMNLGEARANEELQYIHLSVHLNH